MASKVMSLSEAVSRFVHDGMSVVMGTALEALIPFAAGFEIIRQGKRDLNLVGPISDILFDILVGAGVARKISAAWLGNVIAGSGYNIRRAAEQGVPVEVEMEDHSNFTIALALKAGAMAVPFLPTRTALGSDLVGSHLVPMSCPLTGQKLMAVRALEPDLAIIHMQRADDQGNGHLWGHSGITQDALLASSATLVTCEELVAADVIRSDPNRCLVGGFKVKAVVPLAGACLPSSAQGVWNRDHSFYLEYHQQSKSLTGFQDWLKRWVLDTDHQGFLKLLGSERLERLKVKSPALAASVDYGY